METPETIVLPRSGVVLTSYPCGYSRWQLRTGHYEFLVERMSVDGMQWHAGEYYVTAGGARYCVGHSSYRPREECIAWLDAQVLAHRAALLAGDGVREALAVAVASAIGKAPHMKPTDYDRIIADAVLAALRGDA